MYNCTMPSSRHIQLTDKEDRQLREIEQGAHFRPTIKKEAEMTSEEIKREPRPGGTLRAAVLVAALPSALTTTRGREWPTRASK